MCEDGGDKDSRLLQGPQKHQSEQIRGQNCLVALAEGCQGVESRRDDYTGLVAERHHAESWKDESCSPVHQVEDVGGKQRILVHLVRDRCVIDSNAFDCIGKLDTKPGQI